MLHLFCLPIILFAAADDRQLGDCSFPINLLLLQDVTGSMQEAFQGTVEVTLPSLNESMPIEHPGSTFSLATFKDKPIISLGEEGDVCHEMVVLGADTPMAFESFFSTYVPNGGWDWPENQFGAIMAMLNSPNTFPWMTETGTNLVVMVTDSPPHFEGDTAQEHYPQLTPWGTGYEEENADSFCRERYYPSPETVRDALVNTHTHLGQIIISPEKVEGRALKAARWLNSILGQPDDFVVGNYKDTSNWLQEISSILDTLTQHVCSSTPSESSTDAAERSSSTALLTNAPQATLLDTTIGTEEETDATDAAETDLTSIESTATDLQSVADPSILPILDTVEAEPSS